MMKMLRADSIFAIIFSFGCLSIPPTVLISFSFFAMVAFEGCFCTKMHTKDKLKDKDAEQGIDISNDKSSYQPPSPKPGVKKGDVDFIAEQSKRNYEEEEVKPQPTHSSGDVDFGAPMENRKIVATEPQPATEKPATAVKSDTASLHPNEVDFTIAQDQRPLPPAASVDTTNNASNKQSTPAPTKKDSKKDSKKEKKDKNAPSTPRNLALHDAISRATTQPQKTSSISSPSPRVSSTPRANLVSTPQISTTEPAGPDEIDFSSHKQSYEGGLGM